MKILFSILIALSILPAVSAASPSILKSTDEVGSVESIETELSEVDRGIRAALDEGEFHDAIRLLPREAELWTQLKAKTGKYYEGAHGFLHGSVMSHTAFKGDSDWGQILDDPKIPHRYKILLFEFILEERLGKGSVYWGNKENLIVPVHRPIDFKNEEMFRLPDGLTRKKANKTLDRISETKSETDQR